MTTKGLVEPLAAGGIWGCPGAPVEDQSQGNSWSQTGCLPCPCKMEHGFVDHLPGTGAEMKVLAPGDRAGGMRSLLLPPMRLRQAEMLVSWVTKPTCKTSRQNSQPPNCPLWVRFLSNCNNVSNIEDWHWGETFPTAWVGLNRTLLPGRRLLNLSYYRHIYRAVKTKRKVNSGPELLILNKVQIETPSLETLHINTESWECTFTCKYTENTCSLLSVK